MSNGNATANTIHDAGKVQLADAVRLMAENQQTLDLTRAADRRSRDLQARTEEAMARNQLPDLTPSTVSAEEEMNLNIDSPVTTTNHHYPPPTRPQSSTLAKLAVGAVMLASGAGIGLGAVWLADVLRPPPVVTQPVDQDTLFDLRLVPTEPVGE